MSAVVSLARGAQGRRRSCASLLPALLVWSAGCATTPEVPSPVEIPAAFSASGSLVATDRWWEDLGDASLSMLVDEALAGSFELAAAWDRLAQAEAITRREGAGLWPSIDAQADSGTTWIGGSAAQNSFALNGQGTRRVDDFGLGLTLSWELDIFGRLRAARDAAEFERDASAADVQATAVALAAGVADQWYALVEEARQLALLDEQIRTNMDILSLVTVRFRAGGAGAADVLRQRQVVEQRRGERETVKARAAVAEHALAVLLGRVPVVADLPASEVLPDPGPPPAAGFPAELLDRRPDLKRGYREVLAADRQLAAARADRYPRISLTATSALGAQELADLLDNWMASLAANLVAPLFDGGRRRAEVERTRAVVSERIHLYGQQVLTAFREVEDALVQEEQQRALIQSLEAQLELARLTLERLRDRYTKGASDYLDVLDALSSQQSLERDVVGARRDLLGFRIALYRALAGGFELERPALARLEGHS